MASYKIRLERKKKFKEMLLGYKFATSLYFGWIKSKLIPEKLFHNVIINDINSALESGSKEVRYYIYTGMDLYECLEDSYNFYKKSHSNGSNMTYSEDVYTITMLYVKEYFSRFNDIEFYEHDSDICSYFSIKTKF